MAAGLILKFESASRDLYEAVNAQLNVDMKTGTGDWPAGLLSHAAGTDDGGRLVVVEIWESREAQERFMRERLHGALAAGGVTVQPEVTWFDAFSYHTPGK